MSGAKLQGMTHLKPRIDSEIANLDGGLFAGLPHDEIPLTTFRLHEKVIEPDVSDQASTLVMRRVKLDSIAPMSLAAPVVEHAAPAPRRAAPWSFVAGVAVGVGAILAVGLMSKTKAPSAPAATQAALVVAPREAQAAAVPVAVPAPRAPIVAAPKAEPAVKAPAVKAAAPSLKAPAPRAPRVAAVAALEPVAAPVSTADLPIVMPEIPAAPKAPEVQFNRSAAAVSIASKGMGASSCKDEPGSMSIPVSVTFAASGRATRAMINGGPFKGTSTGSCIAAALRGASVPAFDGEAVTVNTSIHLR